MNTNESRKQYAEKMALPMFALSLLFLVLVAILIVNSLTLGEQAESAGPLGTWITGLLLAIWPVFLVDYLLTLWVNRGRLSRKQQLLRMLTWVVPPLRLASPAPSRDLQIWLPGLSWRAPGRQLSQQLARVFGTPMLAIALLILPVLLIEFGFRHLLEQHAWLQTLLHMSTGFIWCAFAVEFIIMISATDKKFAYVKKNWIDLAIILLPLISFLRSVRVLRLARLAKVQKLAKIGRVYRMRGLGMKALRALLLLQVVNRLLRITPEKKLAKLREQHSEKLLELAELEQEISQLETLCADAEAQNNAKRQDGIRA